MKRRCHFEEVFASSPAGTRRNNNVFTTSARRRRRRVDVVKTLSLRHYCVICPLGSWKSTWQLPVPVSGENSIKMMTFAFLYQAALLKTYVIYVSTIGILALNWEQSVSPRIIVLMYTILGLYIDIHSSLLSWKYTVIHQQQGIYRHIMTKEARNPSGLQMRNTFACQVEKRRRVQICLLNNHGDKQPLDKNTAESTVIGRRPLITHWGLVTP